jgi:glycosyltransferase involved in cell wall biosynthesis
VKVLIVCSQNHEWGVATFIVEQADALMKQGVEIDYFYIRKKGIIGYLSNYLPFRQKLKKNTYDLVHAHYGLSGLLASLQRKIPVIVTYHGSDINNAYHRFFSTIAIHLSKFNIFVHSSIRRNVCSAQSAIIPCGIDLDQFYPVSRDQAYEQLNLAPNKHRILFAGAFDRVVKNVGLARQALALTVQQPELIELKNYSREEVRSLMSACDLLLVTSFSETGPLVVKEALACGSPVVSVDVGDVQQLLQKIESSFVVPREPEAIAEKIDLILEGSLDLSQFERSIDTRFDNNLIAEKIIAIYQELLE